MATLQLIIDGRQAKVGSEQFNAAVKSVIVNSKNADAGIATLNTRMNTLGKTAAILRRAFAPLFATLSGYYVIRNAITTISDYETGLIGVGKTTNMVGYELEALGQNFINLSTRIPVVAKELLGIGQTAGQLGIVGADNILVFSDTIAKMAVATDLAGEQGATQLARLLNVTGEATSEIKTLGAVIVALGNSMAATESEITYMATSVGQSTNVFGVTSKQAAALGAVMAALGVQARLGGSGIGRVFRAIDAAVRSGGDQLQMLADITGTTGDEITRVFKTDAITAFKLFVDGLNKIIKTGGDSTAALKSFGLEGEEILKVLPTLANRSELLGDALRIMQEQIANPTALEQEAARAYSSMANRWQKFWNTISAVTLKGRSTVVDIFSEMIETTTQSIRILAGFDGAMKDATPAAKNLADALKIIGTVFVGLATYKVLMLFPTLTIGIVTATKAMWALTAAMAANPIGLIAVGISAAAAALIYYRNEIITIGDKTATVGDIVVATFEWARDTIVGTWKNIYDTSKLVIDWVSGAWADMTDGLGVDWKKVFSYIMNIAKWFANGTIGLFNGLGKTLGVLVNTIWNAMTAFSKFDFSSPVESAQEVAKALGDALNPKAIFSQIGNEWKTAMTTDYIGNLIAAIKNNAPQIQKVLSTALSFTPAGQAYNASMDIWARAVKRKAERDAVETALKWKENFESTLNTAMAGVSTIFDVKINYLTNESSFLAMMQKQNRVTGNGVMNIEAENSLKEMNKELDQELSLIGKTNDEREMAIYLIKAQDQANLAYGKGTDLANQKTSELMGKFDQLQKANRLQEVADNIGSSFSGAFTDMINGATSAGEAIEDLIGSIMNLVIQYSIAQPLAQSISSGITGFSASLFSAHGHAFENGVVAMANGGIVNSPTYFGLAGGRMGLMGEAGPEAVMPLTRTPSGDLGIRAAGGGESNVVVNVINNSGESVSTRESSGANGQRKIDVMIGEMAAKDVVNNGPLGKAIKQTYGLTRAGGRR